MSPAATQRRYQRVDLPKGMAVAWQGAGNRSLARIGTVGLGGLFIKASEPAATGQVIKLIFEIPGGEVRARATVRDSHPGKGMGVEFTGMDPEVRARLSQLLGKLLAAPSK